MNKIKSFKLFEMGNEQKESTYLTMELFNDIPNDEVFASGITTDDSKGANMTNSGKKLKWIAKKGQAEDWVIYIHWA